MPGDGCLEIGGSHVCVGRVDPVTLDLHDFSRHPIDSAADLHTLTAALAAAVGQLRSPLPSRWAVALPGPFDYATGIGGLHPDGKFAAWAGLDVRALLTALLRAEHITFVNDAVAFALGHYFAASGTSRLLGLTLGSGIGSAFIESGRPVSDERVPPGGEVYAEPCGAGLTLEARFGPAALAKAQGCRSFRELAEAARGDDQLREWLMTQFTGLAEALAPWLRSFSPQIIACGGGACRAWDLFGDAFSEQLAALCPGVEVTAEVETERTAMRGAVGYAACRVE